MCWIHGQAVVEVIKQKWITTVRIYLSRDNLRIREKPKCLVKSDFKQNGCTALSISLIALIVDTLDQNVSTLIVDAYHTNSNTNTATAFYTFWNTG